MKGVLILTEGRSGSNWLGSLTNATGTMGTSSEWLDPASFGKDARSFHGAEFLDQAVERSSTANGFFAIKAFPKHLYRFEKSGGIDAIKYIIDRHDVRLIRLIRKDTFRQAISFARGLQSKQWTSQKASLSEPVYDFRQICRCFLLIKQSYIYWEAYTQLRGLESALMYYEDLVDDPAPYVRLVAEHAGVAMPENLSSSLKVQRDSKTEEWLERFKADVDRQSLVQIAPPGGPFRFTASNLVRLWRGRQLK